jgi:hypothetical protein
MFNAGTMFLIVLWRIWGLAGKKKKKNTQAVDVDATVIEIHH